MRRHDRRETERWMHAFDWRDSEADGVQLAVIGIPKTVDNDLMRNRSRAWLWQCCAICSDSHSRYRRRSEVDAQLREGANCRDDGPQCRLADGRKLAAEGAGRPAAASRLCAGAAVPLADLSARCEKTVDQIGYALVVVAKGCGMKPALYCRKFP